MPDLPSGTVTFLFTDIEGSTALWERDRSAMAGGGGRATTPCSREAIEAHGGVLFKTVGDALRRPPSPPLRGRLPPPSTASERSLSRGLE